MCVITGESHVHLDVHPDARPEIAARLLAAAEVAGVCQQNPCHLTTTSEGFRVSLAVYAASGLAEDDEAPAHLDAEGGQADDEAPAAPPVAEVPEPHERSAAARRKSR